MSEIKLVFTGSLGAGKTTAISTISEIPVINTDVATTDKAAQRKEMTTVALDYGELSLDETQKLKLYGTPGQERFEYMWPILIKGALGLIILVDHASADPLSDLALFVRYFKPYIEETATVIGVTRTDLGVEHNMQAYHDYLQKQDLQLPVFTIDARNREHVIIMIQALTAMVEFA
ncbi:GTP-binding protein [Candidatus Thiomargarita nelsonii]|uniref:GTP-binding protein n=1 Tax=Candidatus Thiomargarita nelsonii TaxID=1003181 RepID=A0A0A6P3A8_9GAMM|nr:GTP-binding protein [Candidatus Thiomargarita nelsonii]